VTFSVKYTRQRVCCGGSRRRNGVDERASERGLRRAFGCRHRHSFRKQSWSGAFFIIGPGCNRNYYQIAGLSTFTAITRYCMVLDGRATAFSSCSSPNCLTVLGVAAHSVSTRSLLYNFDFTTLHYKLAGLPINLRHSFSSNQSTVTRG
jgi:hypothetical protein